MKYATIDTTTLTVWGIGSTAEESAADARDNLAYAGIDQAREFGTHTPIAGPMETMECTDAVVDEVDSQGGEHSTLPGHEWTIYTYVSGTKLLKMVDEA